MKSNEKKCSACRWFESGQGSGFVGQCHYEPTEVFKPPGSKACSNLTPKPSDVDVELLENVGELK